LQQPGVPQQQSPYMMMGGSQQQQQSQQITPQQQYAPYMMQPGGMKAAAVPPQSQQYYGNMGMGRQAMGQSSLAEQGQRMGNQLQKPAQDYTGFQPQQMQHRYPQVLCITSCRVFNHNI